MEIALARERVMNTNRDRVTIVKGEGWEDFIDHAPHDRMEPIGTIRVGSSLEGALLIDHTDGCYVMIKKDGSEVELNQRKVQAAVDALVKVGKPRAGYEVRELHSIRLEPSDAEYLRQAGDGNLSEGIRKITRERRKREQPK